MSIEFTPAQKEAIESIQKDMREFVFGSEEIAQRIINLSPEEMGELRRLLLERKHAPKTAADWMLVSNGKELRDSSGKIIYTFVEPRKGVPALGISIGIDDAS